MFKPKTEMIDVRVEERKYIRYRWRSERVLFGGACELPASILQLGTDSISSCFLWHNRMFDRLDTRCTCANEVVYVSLVPGLREWSSY